MALTGQHFVPKRVKYPRLKTLVRKGASGQRWVYYYYDRRVDGLPDIALGKDYAAAIERWDELHHKKPRAKGRVQEAANRWRLEVLPSYVNPETRRSYGRQLAKIEGVFGQMAWDEITLPLMREYLSRRKAKRQGNAEMSVFSIVWSHARMWGMTALHWPAEGVKRWKNTESPRRFEVTDALFEAVYSQADQVLRDCMDIATATGMRLTDVRTVVMPADEVLQFRASKTKKAAAFDIASSPVLARIVERRRALPAGHLMLLSTPAGRPVTAGMLRQRYDAARKRAAEAFPGLAQEIEGMWLRDMRKRASALANSAAEASELLQHSSKAVTEKHYRQTVSKLRAVR